MHNFDGMISAYYFSTAYMLNLDNGWLHLATGSILVNLKRFPAEMSPHSDTLSWFIAN